MRWTLSEPAEVERPRKREGGREEVGKDAPIYDSSPQKLPM